YIRALWEVLVRSQRWREIAARQPDGLMRYLRKAVSGRAKGIRRDREMGDRQWARLDAADRRRPGRPGKVPEWVTSPVFEKLLSAGLHPDQERVARLLRAGYTPAQALQRLALPYSAYIGLRSRILRRLRPRSA